MHYGSAGSKAMGDHPCHALQLPLNIKDGDLTTSIALLSQLKGLPPIFFLKIGK